MEIIYLHPPSTTGRAPCAVVSGEGRLEEGNRTYLHPPSATGLPWAPLGSRSRSKAQRGGWLREMSVYNAGVFSNTAGSSDMSLASPAVRHSPRSARLN